MSPDKGEETARPTNGPPAKREAPVVRRLLGGTTSEKTIIPPQVYELISEIVTFTWEVEEKAQQQQKSDSP